MSNASTKRARDSTPELDVRRAGRKRVTRARKGAERVSLRSVREAVGKTQFDVALALGTDQGEVSHIERRSDVMTSTLRKYAAALGARCDVAFVTVTRHGKEVVVIVSLGDYERRRSGQRTRGSVFAFLRQLEFSRAKLNVERTRDRDRNVTF
jgi:transcriptional regulator with XRE-family HTH domain